jgi:hypothetical protein
MKEIQKMYYSRVEFSQALDVDYQILVRWEKELKSLKKNIGTKYCSLMRNGKRYFTSEQFLLYAEVKRFVEIDKVKVSELKDFILNLKSDDVK